MSLPDADLLVIGGGINGAGIARDAAGRGLRVVLCEKDDLASHTSSASSKLIHGGLRYLEHYEFALVRKALQEREVLLKLAPHLIKPLRFVMPLAQGMRPAWLIRLGLFLYDHLANLDILLPSQAIDLRRHPAGQALQSDFQRGFEYADGWVHDARLVVANAIDSAERGARILTRTQCTDLQRHSSYWLASLRSQDGQEHQLRCRAIANAAGPWAMQVAQLAIPGQFHSELRLIKGSHIVVKRLFEHDFAYIFQNQDKRIVFALPYQQDYTLIGTTELDYQGELDQVGINSDETEYLCGLANRYFKSRISAQDVIASFAGVRPLLAATDGRGATELARDYHLELDTAGAPVLQVWGGKITTYRLLAEQAINLLAPHLAVQSGAWTANSCLPGADCYGVNDSQRSRANYQRFCREMAQQYDWLPPELLQRYLRQYGSRTLALLEQRRSLDEMGEQLMPGLYQAEVRYLMRHEWAWSAADILKRRTELGARLAHADSSVLSKYMQSQQAMLWPASSLGPGAADV